MSREEKFTLYLELYDYFETRKTIPLYLETMKHYKSPEEMVVYETPYPSDLIVSKEINTSELASNIPEASVGNDILGVVLGNRNFNDPKIKSPQSTGEDVKLIRKYFKNLFNLDDIQISKLEIPTGNPLFIEFNSQNKIILCEYLDKERAKDLLVF